MAIRDKVDARGLRKLIVSAPALAVVLESDVLEPLGFARGDTPGNRPHVTCVAAG